MGDVFWPASEQTPPGLSQALFCGTSNLRLLGSGRKITFASSLILGIVKVLMSIFS